MSVAIDDGVTNRGTGHGEPRASPRQLWRETVKAGAVRSGALIAAVALLRRRRC